MNDLVFLIINASVVCFVISYCLLKIFRSKVLLLCLVFSPFIFIPATGGFVKEWFVGYLFVLQYGSLGIVFGILLFEIDQIKRARKLRFFTSFLAKIIMIFPLFYVFIYIAKSFISSNDTVGTSVEYASLFGIIVDKDIAIVEHLGSFFHITGVIFCVVFILACVCALIFNKYRAFREIQRI